MLDGCPLLFLWVSVSSSFAIISLISFKVVLRMVVFSVKSCSFVTFGKSWLTDVAIDYIPLVLEISVSVVRHLRKYSPQLVFSISLHRYPGLASYLNVQKKRIQCISESEIQPFGMLGFLNPFIILSLHLIWLT